MIESFSRRVLLIFLGLSVPFSLWANEPTTAEASNTNDTTRGTNQIFVPVSPGPADGRIAFVIARMLEQLNYMKQPFDDSISARFFDRYLQTLDPQHMHFTQADLAEFDHYRTNLDNLTITRRGVGDVTPGCEIFNRFVLRLQQRVKYAEELLKTESFTFDADERITINRDKMPYPKDLEEAHKLWRERLRFEYLQEKLGKIAAVKKKEKEKDKPAKTEKEENGASSTEAKPKKTEAQEIVETLGHRYQRNLKTFTDFDNDDVLEIYLTALGHVYDPHSDYLGKDQLDSFAIGMNLSLFGIGAELRSEDGYCTINRLLPGGPAIKSGKIKEKDRIVAVSQGDGPMVDVVDMHLNKAVQLIRGPKGTEVRLKVIPAGEDASSTKLITLVRDEIPLEDQAAKAKIIETTGEAGEPLRLGVIDLLSFYAPMDFGNARGKGELRSTSADVAKLLIKLRQEKVNGVILDLRRNGGGSLEEAIRLTGLFIKAGCVVQVKDWEGNIQKDEDTDPLVLYDGPLMVLTSRFSASASEIVAGALQDYGRALLVGDASTHGKGTVQSVNTLKPYVQGFNKDFTNDPGALKVTIKKFYRASGASTQLKGVTPDIILPSVISESEDFGESSLENPMQWDTIDSANYEHLNRVGPYLAELRNRSRDRLGKDPEYAYIRDDISLFKKHQADKTISLNLNERLKEKEEADARQKARDKERLLRPESPDTVYEITLKNADLPGLPAPMPKTNSLARAELKTQGVLNTNSPVASAASAPVTPTSPDDELLDEEKPPVVDAPMIEAQHILVDYVSLLSKHNVVSVGSVGSVTK